jgi:hypothetical protein
MGRIVTESDGGGEGRAKRRIRSQLILTATEKGIIKVLLSCELLKSQLTDKGRVYKV